MFSKTGTLFVIEHCYHYNLNNRLMNNLNLAKITAVKPLKRTGIVAVY